jgi:hypothetical protein
MRLLAAKLAVVALASLAAATMPKSGKPTILRVKKSDGAVKRVAFDGAATLDELQERAHADELFGDEACTRACTADDLKHGSIVYERPLEKGEEPAEAADEEFFSPYPDLQKKSSLRAKRRQKNLRANTWKELLREREGVFYVKSFERVCDMCRLSQDCVEELSGRGAHAAWLIGRRGLRKENATTFAESAYACGVRDDDVFEIAQLCGLEVVGVAVVRADADGDDKSILLTPYEVALISELQVEAMRRCETLKRPFSFPTLIIAPRSSGGLATEAFEASELTVQMAAERVLELSGDQPTEADARVRTRDVFLRRPRFSSSFFACSHAPALHCVARRRRRGPPRAMKWVSRRWRADVYYATTRRRRGRVDAATIRRSSSSTARTRRTSTRASCIAPCPSGRSLRILPWRRPSTWPLLSKPRSASGRSRLILVQRPARRP